MLLFLAQINNFCWFQLCVVCCELHGKANKMIFFTCYIMEHIIKLIIPNQTKQSSDFKCFLTIWNIQ